MSTSSLVGEVDRLVGLLRQGKPIELGAIPWASPVLAFGDPMRSRIATLGLNPSNLEFVDNRGRPLLAPHHRFESLTTLDAEDWSDVAKQGVRKVWQACEDYFLRNPYDQWFKRLEKILIDTGSSYYSSLGDRACHLDLVPFATGRKWSELSSNERVQLIDLGAPSLAKAVRASEIRVLVLNGSAVVREFNRIVPDGALNALSMPSWSLQGGRVTGIAHLGRTTRLGSLKLDRELLVLGYNHNIQSSFGVTAEVVSRIADWVGQRAREVLQ